MLLRSPTKPNRDRHNTQNVYDYDDGENVSKKKKKKKPYGGNDSFPIK